MGQGGGYAKGCVNEGELKSVGEDEEGGGNVGYEMGRGKIRRNIYGRVGWKGACVKTGRGKELIKDFGELTRFGGDQESPCGREGRARAKWGKEKREKWRKNSESVVEKHKGSKEVYGKERWKEI